MNTSCLHLQQGGEAEERTAQAQSEEAPSAGEQLQLERPWHGHGARLPRGHQPGGRGEAAAGGGHGRQLPAAGQ